MLKVGDKEHQIEALPDGTVVYGVEQFLRGMHNSQEQVEVRLRPDLVDRGEAAALLRLGEDYLGRRDLALWVRICGNRRVWELALGRQYGEWTRPEQQRFKDKVRSCLECSRRTTERYVRLLTLPREVQEALGAGAITLNEAQGLCRLTTNTCVTWGC